MTEAAKDAESARPLHETYVAELRIHAVMLVWLGYRRLNAADLMTAEEDNITGELVREIESVLEEPSSPAWVDHYEVREQVPQNVRGKRGKRRPKLDVEVKRHQRGPRPSLRFEAKRLGRGATIGAYLGQAGLGAFLDGHYSTTHAEAGMLGYVQEGANEDWSTKLARKLSSHAAKYRVADGAGLRAMDVEPSMPAFQSAHTDLQGAHLMVTHVLLCFTR